MSNCKRRALSGAVALLCLLAGTVMAVPISADSASNFAISSPAPDIIIDSITCSPEEPVIGDTATFTVTIRNQGDGPAGSSKIAYYIDDTYLKSAALDLLSPGASVIKTFTWPAQPGAHHIRAIADAENNIEESDEANNDKTFAFSVLAPDLVIESITWSPENPSTGDKVAFTVTIRNQGTKRAGTSHVDFYIDGNSRGYRHILGIEPGASVNETYNWVAMSGTYTVSATADLLHQVTESDETNNDLETSYATAAPDLVIDSVTWTPQNPTENTTVTFTITIKNQGSGKSPPFDAAFYIDNSLEATAFISTMNPGANTARIFQWTAENRSRTFTAVADLNNKVGESDETNNTMTLGLPTSSPDLIIASVTTSPTSPLVAHRMTFNVTVKNQGKSRAGFMRVYLHIKGVDSLYEEIAELAAGATANATFPWASQDYSQEIEVVVDAENYIFESDESNNIMTKTVTFTDPSPTADLVIQEITATPANPILGDAVSIAVIIKNQGAELTNPSHMDYYVDDTLLTSVYVAQIKAGGTTVKSVSWPAEAGTHTLKATLDVNNAIAETDEANNESTLTITTSAPDLFITSADWSPKNPTTGDVVTFTVGIKNRGDYKASSSYLTYYVDDLYRGSHYVAEIAPGATTIKTFTWQAHTNPHGFRVVIDEENTVAESDESNNERAASLPAPDLIIDSIGWSPPNPTENTTVTFTVTVRNDGGGWSDNPLVAFYIDDNMMAPTPTVSLDSGDIATSTFTWMAQAGEHVFRATADQSDIITESDEYNNEKTVTLTVKSEPVAMPLPLPEPETLSNTTTATEQPDVEVTASIATPDAPPTGDDTTGQDIADKIAAEPAKSRWQEILLNRWFIIGLGVAGAAAILLLLRLRKKAST